MRSGDLTMLDAFDRLKMLRSLKDGWLDGGGKSIDPSALRWFGMLFYVSTLAVSEHRCDIPWIYPTPDGGVRLEWSYDDEELGAEYDPQTKIWTIDSLGTWDSFQTDDIGALLQVASLVRIANGGPQ